MDTLRKDNAEIELFPVVVQYHESNYVSFANQCTAPSKNKQHLAKYTMMYATSGQSHAKFSGENQL